MSIAIDTRTEWLETDGLGGFASGTTDGARTRRYHALLVAATSPPTGRLALINGLEMVASTAAGEFVLSNEVYTPGVVTRSSEVVIERFERSPWPRWTFRLTDGVRIVHEVFVRHGSPTVIASWRAIGSTSVRLRVRPLISGRDYHALHHENDAAPLDAQVHEGRVRWRTYADTPAVTAHHNGEFRREPVWHRNFELAEERARGFEFVEDLASPGVFEFDLGADEGAIIFAAEAPGADPTPMGAPIRDPLASLRAAERQRRAALGGTLEVAADAYLVRRGEGSTIIAGYPWFADWGRDTMIAVRGLCTSTGRVSEALSVLERWAAEISEGMLPNRFPDDGGEPEFNSVDASLWFIVAADEALREANSMGMSVPPSQSAALRDAIERIVSAYARGTRFGIRMDDDGLLAAGEPGVQLTWMDARVDGREVTPRIGKPVEVQALWINALRIAAHTTPSWSRAADRALASFRERFWNEEADCLFDVVDVDHVAGVNDGALRPNQILAVGGLPFPLLHGDRARRVVERVEARLLTPLGLRSLAPDEPGYAPRYEGDPRQRDGSYHQGTVWPWLIGPFVEAWLRVRGGRPIDRIDARNRFLRPLLRHLELAGLGHVSEIADAEYPHTPRGCPFQAWSVGEALRLDRVVLAAEAPGRLELSGASRPRAAVAR